MHLFLEPELEVLGAPGIQVLRLFETGHRLGVADEVAATEHRKPRERGLDDRENERPLVAADLAGGFDGHDVLLFWPARRSDGMVARAGWVRKVLPHSALAWPQELPFSGRDLEVW